MCLSVPTVHVDCLLQHGHLQVSKKGIMIAVSFALVIVTIQ